MVSSRRYDGTRSPSGFKSRSGASAGIHFAVVRIESSAFLPKLPIFGAARTAKLRETKEIMKDLKQILVSTLLLLAVTVGPVPAFDSQKDKDKNPPKKDPAPLNNGDRNRENKQPRNNDKNNDNNRNSDRGKKDKP
jgi:hypothetical protein